MQIPPQFNPKAAWMPRFLVLGASGMLGRSWTSALDRHGLPFRSLSRVQIDYTDPEKLLRAVGDDYDWVVNCSGYTDVDAAESEWDAAFESNASFVQHLGEACSKSRTGVVHFSTDYVFDGQAQVPYITSHEVNPINAYGRTKAEGESRLLATDCRSLIIRTSWLYAAHGKNFLRTMLKLIQDRDSVNVVADQVGRPTNADHLVESTLKLLSLQRTGIHHVANSGYCSWYEFAKMIQACSGIPCQIHPCDTDAFPRPAKRPSYSVLDLAETEQCLGPTADWRAGIRESIEKLRENTVTDRQIASHRSALRNDLQLEPLL